MEAKRRSSGVLISKPFGPDPPRSLNDHERSVLMANVAKRLLFE